MKIFEIVIFVAVILAVVLYRVNKAYREYKWRKERAKQTAKLRLEYRNRPPYDQYRVIKCNCGYIAEDGSKNWIKKRRYYENDICPCCGRRWKTVEDEDWSW